MYQNVPYDLPSYFQTDDSSSAKIPERFHRFAELNILLTKQIDQLFSLQLDPKLGVFRGDVATFLQHNPTYSTEAFTVLSIDAAGEPCEIPYYIAYNPYIRVIIKTIGDICEEIRGLDDQQLPPSPWIQFYHALALGFSEDRWEEAEIEFLKLGTSSPFLLAAGAIEKYHDLYFGSKKFYSAAFLFASPHGSRYVKLWRLGVEINDQHTDILSAGDSICAPHLFIGDTVAHGGEVGKLNAEAWSRPSSVALGEEFGSIKMLMLNTFYSKSPAIIAAAHRGLEWLGISESDQQKLVGSIDDNSLSNLVLHELGHTFRKRSWSGTELDREYTFIEECRAEINSVWFALEIEKRWPEYSGLALKLFISDLALFNYKWDRHVTTGYQEEYLLSTILWLRKLVEHGIAEVAEDGFGLDLAILEKKFPALVAEIFTFVDTISTFSVGAHPALVDFKNGLRAFGQRLSATLASGSDLKFAAVGNG